MLFFPKNFRGFRDRNKITKSKCNVSDSNTRLRFERIWPQLVSANVVIRIEDLIIQVKFEKIYLKKNF